MNDSKNEISAEERAAAEMDDANEQEAEVLVRVVITDGEGVYVYSDPMPDAIASSVVLVLGAVGITAKTDNDEVLLPLPDDMATKDRAALLLAHAFAYAVKTDEATLVEDFDEASSNSESGYEGVYFDSVQLDGEGTLGDVEVNWSKDLTPIAS